MQLEPVVLGLMLAGTAVYAAYQIEKRRKEIRKTIQVIELNDTNFWEELSKFRTRTTATA